MAHTTEYNAVEKKEEERSLCSDMESSLQGIKMGKTKQWDQE